MAALEYAMTADTISVPMLIANASEVIALGENGTLATTRKAAATRASHEMNADIMMLFLLGG